MNVKLQEARSHQTPRHKEPMVAQGWLVLGFGPSVGPLDRNVSWFSDDVTCGLWDRISSPCQLFKQRVKALCLCYDFRTWLTSVVWKAGKGGWGGSLVGTVLVVQTWGPELDPKSYIKNQVLCTLWSQQPWWGSNRQMPQLHIAFINVLLGRWQFSPLKTGKNPTHTKQTNKSRNPFLLSESKVSILVSLWTVTSEKGQPKAQCPADLFSSPSFGMWWWRWAERHSKLMLCSNYWTT